MYTYTIHNMKIITFTYIYVFMTDDSIPVILTVPSVALKRTIFGYVVSQAQLDLKFQGY